MPKLSSVPVVPVVAVKAVVVPVVAAILADPEVVEAVGVIADWKRAVIAAVLELPDASGWKAEAIAGILRATVDAPVSELERAMALLNEPWVGDKKAIPGGGAVLARALEAAGWSVARIVEGSGDVVVRRRVR